jgi:uncharacterized secreted repeat protein (TIGR03808 family)
MMLDRRKLLTTTLAVPASALAARAGIAAPAPPPPNSLNAIALGVRSGAEEDQSKALQKAIDHAASRRLPLFLPPGRYKAAELKLSPGTQIYGMRGGSHLVLNRTAPLLYAEHAAAIALNGLTLDGDKVALRENGGLVEFSGGQAIRISDCELLRAAGNAVVLRECEAQVTGNAITDSADTALFSLDGRNVIITGNRIRGSGNGGIRVWQSQKRADNAIIADNQIDDTKATAGGSGQNGNAVNIYRAGNVIVRGNRISNAAFSAVRGNAASHIQMIGNNCTGIGEVALYCEFDFENAAITGNMVDGAAIGVAVTNFKEGGRLATVQGNVLRNITSRRPEGTDPNDGFGIGIGVEADTAVTGNVIENAATVGIAVGNGPYLRDCTVTGNIVRNVPYGIWVSVAKGAGAAVIANNLITGSRRGAIVGMEWTKVVTADLALVAPGAYPQLTVSANRVR